MVLLQIKTLDAVALQAELHEAVHLLQPVNAVDPVPICSKFSQMAQACQLCFTSTVRSAPHRYYRDRDATHVAASQFGYG